MTAVHVTKFNGSQGNWEAEVTYSDGSKEVLRFASEIRSGLAFTSPTATR